MREPAFWSAPRSLLARLLSPLGYVYGAVAAMRMRRDGVEAGVPVICVGNYGLGGAGKTPTALALMALLRDLGERPVVLSRGHGGRLKGPVVVDPSRHRAAEVGDEPLMMAAHVTAVIARDRVGGAALARARGASVIVMDDGFQNPTRRKHAAIIVIDGTRGVGNGLVFPAGPLRAPLPMQLERSDALIVIGEGRGADAAVAALATRNKPAFQARFAPDPASVAALSGRRVLAFAGIGDPPRFFRTLQTAGVDVVATRAFPDHHVYTPSDIAALRASAVRDGLILATTEKDIARLGADGEGIALFAVTLVFDDAAAVKAFVAQRLAAARMSTFRSAW